MLIIINQLIYIVNYEPVKILINVITSKKVVISIII